MHMSVERFAYLHERELDEWMNRIKVSFRPDEQDESAQIRKAVSLVRKGAFFDFRFSLDATVLIATVTDEGEQTVKLAPSSVPPTACTCDKENWCVHKIAAVFHLYSQFHSLTEWLHDWQRRETEQMALTVSARTPEAWNDVLYKLTKPLRELAAGDNPNVFLHENSMMDAESDSVVPFRMGMEAAVRTVLPASSIGCGLVLCTRTSGTSKPCDVSSMASQNVAQ